MSATKKYRDQHEVLLESAGAISSFLDEATLPGKAPEVRKLLTALFAKLKMHLAIENESLYPRLLQSNAIEVRTTAENFQQEMGDIGIAVQAYNEKWAASTAIANEPALFIEETNSLFKALSGRIQRENQDLYMLYDKVA